MRPLTTAELRKSLQEVQAPTEEFRSRLAQDAFSGRYEDPPSWAIGPFHKQDGLTFRLEGQWPDPTGIGWQSSAIFNPSIIEHDGRLIAFYRASPRMESTASRIGIARLEADGWHDGPGNPIIFPTQDNELLGCEDPKIYRADGRYFLFYNAIFPIDPADVERYPSPQAPVDAVGCDIALAVSDDLRSWQKMGAVVPHEVSRLWAKGAVIPRLPNGEAARVDGRYLMFVSEGCGGQLQVGSSDDLVTWTFEARPYLDMSALGGFLHEVACAVVRRPDDDRIVLDFYYADRHGMPAAAQALLRTTPALEQEELSLGGTLGWGGLIQHDGAWLFAQGWDAAPGVRELFFYRAEASP